MSGPTNPLGDGTRPLRAGDRAGRPFEVPAPLPGPTPYLIVKRFLDVVVSASALVVLSPLLAALAVWIKIDSRGPVFFRQRRVGLGGREFVMLKFRSMRVDAPKETPTHMLRDPHLYITRSGRFLRRSSLDELPQLLNVMTGKMSLVGPRPALWNQEDLVAARERWGANSVRPGVTGWAQVRGRDELLIDEKAALDGYYVQHLGPLMDLRCLWATASSVFHAAGVVEGGTGDSGNRRSVSD